MAGARVTEGSAWRFVTLDEPGTRNAVSDSAMTVLEECCSACEADSKGLCILGSGSGFSSGANLRELTGLDRNSAIERSLRAQRLCAHLTSAPYRTISAVHGHCIGKGLEIALACGRIAASSDAYFQLPEMLMGFVPGSGGERLLRRRVGGAVADELLVTGRKVSIEEALRLGIVDATLSGAMPPAESELDRVWTASFGVTGSVPLKVDEEFARRYANIITSAEARKRLKKRLEELEGR